MIVSQTETIAVLSGYFHFENDHDLISFLLELFGFSELLTISKMEIVDVFEWLFPFWKIPPLVVRLFRTTDCFQNENSRQLLQNLQQLRINREFRFFYETTE